MSPTRIAAVAMAVAAIAATGCGTSNKALSHGELVAKANSICKRLNTQHKSINIRTQEEYIRLLKTTAAEDQIAFTELAKLTPPTSLASDWKQFVADGRALAQDATQLATYLTTYNRRSASMVNRSTSVVMQAIHTTAERDGLTECAQFA
jgi:hypothetical protein